MNTDKLIDALVADNRVRAAPLSQRLIAVSAAGFLAAVTLFVLIAGVRPDIAEAMTTWRFALKLAIMASLAILAARLAYFLATPGRDLASSALLAVLPGMTLCLAVAAECSLIPAASWEGRAIGSNALICLTIVPALGLPILGAFLLGLREGAPSSPAVAGAAAGVAAGAAAAFLYGTHCTDDSPLFVAIWYTIAIAFLTGAGAILGKFYLKW